MHWRGDKWRVASKKIFYLKAALASTGKQKETGKERDRGLGRRDQCCLAARWNVSAAGWFSRPLIFLLAESVPVLEISRFAADKSRIWTKAGFEQRLNLPFPWSSPCFDEPRSLKHLPLIGCPCFVERRGAPCDAGQARDKHGTGAGQARAIVDSAKEEFGVGGSGRAGRYNNHWQSRTFRPIPCELIPLRFSRISNCRIISVVFPLNWLIWHFETTMCPQGTRCKGRTKRIIYERI